ncbi:MAG: hypothetical protein Ct9H300mP28_07310 [Pseudomonadota bacterium]|nr:MAG: hypothetical protein Ct9H300mP28_07310 [Pseudomonadota bacterium]
MCATADGAYLLVSRVIKLDGRLGEFKPSTVTTE